MNECFLGEKLFDLTNIDGADVLQRILSKMLSLCFLRQIKFLRVDCLSRFPFIFFKKCYQNSGFSNAPELVEYDFLTKINKELGRVLIMRRNRKSNHSVCIQAALAHTQYAPQLFWRIPSTRHSGWGGY